MQALNILNYCKYIEAPIYNTECTNEKGPCSTESQNHQGWETPPGASIPATNPAPPQSPSFPNATSRIIIPTTLPQQKGQFLTSNKINPTKILLLFLHKKLGFVWNNLDLMFMERGAVTQQIALGPNKDQEMATPIYDPLWALCKPLGHWPGGEGSYISWNAKDYQACWKTLIVEIAFLLIHA